MRIEILSDRFVLLQQQSFKLDEASTTTKLHPKCFWTKNCLSHGISSLRSSSTFFQLESIQFHRSISHCTQLHKFSQSECVFTQTPIKSFYLLKRNIHKGFIRPGERD